MMNNITTIRLLLGATLALHYAHASEKVIISGSDDGGGSTATLTNDDGKQHKTTNYYYERGGLRWCNLGVSLISCPLTTAAMLDKYANLTSTTSADDDGNTNHCLDDSSWLLHPTSGFVPRGKLCGIIGPSGAGKSTFLNALGGATLTGGVYVTGTSYYEDNGEQHNQQQQQSSSTMMKLSQQMGDIAYLSQHDNLRR